MISIKKSSYCSKKPLKKIFIADDYIINSTTTTYQPLGCSGSIRTSLGQFSARTQLLTKTIYQALIQQYQHPHSNFYAIQYPILIDTTIKLKHLFVFRTVSITMPEHQQLSCPNNNNLYIHPQLSISQNSRHLVQQWPQITQTTRSIKGRGISAIANQTQYYPTTRNAQHIR